MSDPQFLKNVTLFAEFDSEELQVLAETVRSSRYFPGDTVLEEGSANRALHILKSGRIRVSRKVQEREVTLCDLDARPRDLPPNVAERRRQILARHRRRPPPPHPADQRRRPQLLRGQPRARRERDLPRGVRDV